MQKDDDILAIIIASQQRIEFLKRGDIPSAHRREVIETFTDNSIVVTLIEDTKVYRYWVEGFNGPKGHSV